jgi:hypothetical protein
MLAGAAAVSAKVTAPAQDNMILYSAEGTIQEFALHNGDGDEGTVGVARDQLTDGNGNNVGRHHWQCMRSDLSWYCTGVISLKDTAKTDKRTITVAGLFYGFNGESFAITGGTGAYAGASGTVVLFEKNGQLARTVKLIP